MSYDFKEILRKHQSRPPVRGWPPGTTPPEPSVPVWIPESWRDPVAFWNALEEVRRQGPLSCGGAEDGFDFVHDLVVRHDTDTKQIAFCWYDSRAATLQSLSYAELNTRSASLANDWSQRGVKRGEGICLILPLGPELVVSLIAALRLGLRLSLLPPLGPRYLAPRLALLEFQHCVARDADLPKLQGVKSILSPEPGPEAPESREAPPPALYKPGEPLAVLFPVFDEPSSPPVELTCDAVYLRAVRDGLLTLPLEPNQRLAAPGFALLQHQPALLLITLLQGATFLHLEPEELKDVPPQLLEKNPVRHLGVSRALRDALSHEECRIKVEKGGSWFREPAEPMDTGWETFIVKHELRKWEITHFNLTLEAAAGGATLLSTPRGGFIHAEVFPAAGRPWRLLDISAKGASGAQRDAVGSVGLFAAVEDAQRPAAFVLSQVGAEDYFHGGTLEPRRAGQLYPSTEVRAALSDLSFVTGTAVVPVLADGMAHDFVLLVFTGAEEPGVTANNKVPRENEIHQRLEEQLGGVFLPDRIEFFPLLARYAHGAVDEDWCRMQYTIGMLSRKSSQRVFQLITQLRQLVREPTVLFRPSGGLLDTSSNVPQCETGS